MYSLLKLQCGVSVELNIFFNDTHREKSSSNKIPALTKSMNINIWVAGTSKQLFIKRFLKLKPNFLKNKVVTPFFVLRSSKEFLDIQATIECRFTLKRVRDMIRTYSPFFVIGPICTHYSICLNIGF